jgi:hypothetical protein
MSNQRKTENPTGAGKKPALRVTFDGRLKLELHGSQVRSDADLLAYREPDEALGLTNPGENLLNDYRLIPRCGMWLVGERGFVPDYFGTDWAAEIGNCDVKMKADHGKTTATTEVVSLHPVETRHWNSKRRRNTSCAGKNPVAD